MSNNRQLPISISEIFGPTVQGEGTLIGVPTVFVRTGGCDYRCSWCDTMYAVDPKYHKDWTPMMADEIMNRVCDLVDSPILITLSGGNPAIQSLQPLLHLGHDMGFTFALETQGSIAREWFRDLDFLTISPKGPSSGNITHADSVRECIQAGLHLPTTCLKIVIFDEDDLAYAQQFRLKFPEVSMILQVGNADIDPDLPLGASRQMLLDEYRDLVDRVLVDPILNRCLVLPQLHALIWGNKRGV